jgi:hypothetical protein
MKRLLLVLVAVTVALGVTTSARADEDPFSGRWRAIDADYSHWKLTITAGEDPGDYVISGRDNKNTNCDDKPALTYGTATEALVQANPEGTLFLPGLIWNVTRDCATVDNPSGGGEQPIWLEGDGTLWMNQGPNFRLTCFHRNNDPKACPPLDENDFGWFPGG